DLVEHWSRSSPNRGKDGNSEIPTVFGKSYQNQTCRVKTDLVPTLPHLLLSSSEPAEGPCNLFDFTPCEPRVGFKHEQVLPQPYKILACPKTFDDLVGWPAAA